MAVASEEFRSRLPWANPEGIAKLNREGRTPMVFFRGLVAESHEASQEQEDSLPQVLIPGVDGKRGRKITISPEEAHQIAVIQQELLRE